MAREHVIDPSVVHHQWDLDLEPLLVIDSGDTVHFDIKVAGEGQVWPGASYDDTRFDLDTIYNLSGPIWVNGAEPGDTLQVDVLDLRHGEWGWAAEISLPFKTGSSIVWFSLAWAVIGIFWALWWSRRRQLTSISLSVEV